MRCVRGDAARRDHRSGFSCMDGRCRLAVVTLLLLAGVIGCAATPPIPPVAPALPTTAQAGATTVVAVAPPAAPCCKMTLWEFLGVKRAFEVLGGLLDRIRNRLGARFPGLEAKPPVLAITDPANMNSDNPAVKSAAETKAEEDAAEQKIKALNYLGEMGCAGCYPGIEEALLAGLDDCTEGVRYAAVKALRGTTGTPCKKCKTTACCSPAVIAKLRKIANDIEPSGCYKEPSARVRRLARLAMSGCGDQPAAPPETAPTEGPPAPTPPPAVATADEVVRPNGQLAVSEPPAETPLATAAPATASMTPAPVAAPAPSGQLLAKVDGRSIYESEILPRIQQDVQLVSYVMPAPQQNMLKRELVEREVNALICATAIANEHAGGHSAGCCDPPPGGGSGVHYEQRVTQLDISRYHQAHATRFSGMFPAQSTELIRNEILQSRRGTAERNYVQALRKAGRVWTVFDSQGQGHVRSH
jgi:hypothetical protein